MKHVVVAVTLLLAFGSQWAAAAVPSVEEIWRVVQAQQVEIDKLKAALTDSQRELDETRSTLASAEEKLARSREDLSDTNDRLESAAAMFETQAGSSASAANVSIGGYGELHYNNLDDGNEIDFHRFVLFFGHQFSDTLSFYSELELEHAIAGDGEAGEIELEQAFVQWDYAENHRARAGLFLIPVGIMNETHEPDTFYGVERNSIEKEIIPATWWEAGVGFEGDIAPGWTYDVAVHSGLNLDIGNANPAKRSSIRSGRQKVSEANADSLAYTARLAFSGIPGIQWQTAFQYQTDMAQGSGDDIDGTLFETDLSITRGNFGLRALYAQWDLDSAVELLNPGADEQYGWYVEPSLKLGNGFGVFARYGRYDLTAGNSAASNERRQLDIGVNYWLDEHVVIKADFQRQDNENGTDVDGFNLGVGYSF